MAVVVDALGLTRRVGEVDAVDDLDLQVHRGEVFALLGPTGAGKSTTLDLLTGTRQRTGGSLRVLGHDPGRDDRSWRSRVGVVPQRAARYIGLTVREVIEHFAAFYPDAFRLDELLAMAGLSHRQGTLSDRLTDGEQRRLDLAVGVVGRPELVVLDEPTTGLDPHDRHEAWALIRSLHHQGRTIVFSTHYLDEVRALADRTAVLVDGRVLHLGTLSELRSAVGRRYRVRFAMPALPEVDDDLAVEIADVGGNTTYSTNEPTRLLKLVIEAAERRGLAEVPSLQVSEPDLEDTYLSLVAEAIPEVVP
ncbi:MAG: ABC transporter ATP-binding protein [Actinomycetales bacterium]